MSMNLFMINGEIIFDAHSCELRPLDDQTRIITLHAPTARCLQLLLEKRGEVISRDSFLEVVWQSRGIIVSQNTFYQNISLLRKSLKKSGLSADIIVTVRSKGFIVPAETRVETLDAEPAVHAGPASQPVQKAFSRINGKIPRWLILLFVLATGFELVLVAGDDLIK